MKVTAPGDICPMTESQQWDSGFRAITVSFLEDLQVSNPVYIAKCFPPD